MRDAPHIISTQRADTAAETELNALAAVYRFILDCHAKKETARPSGPGDHERFVSNERGLLWPDR